MADYGSILSCNSTTNVNDLFAFSVSSLAPTVASLEFNLRVVVDSNSVNSFEITLPVSVTMDLFQYNFPVKVSQAIISGNVSIDLNQDGVKEVIVGGEERQDSVYKALQ